MNNLVNKEQNKDEYLRYRYACRKLYSDEKKYRGFIITVGIIIYLIGFIPNLQITVILPVVWIVVSELLKRNLLDIHKKAVDYHEYNDREMFGLTQLTKLIDNHNALYQGAITIISNEKDKKNFEEMVKKEHKVSIKNWYNDFKGIPSDIAIIMAQDENVNWEKNQRKIYESILFLILLIIVMISSPVIYFTTSKFTNIIFAIPVIWDIIVLILDNNDSIRRCNSIIGKVGEVYSYIKNNGKNYHVDYVEDKVIEIQFNIYENRKDSIPVSDIVYSTFRKRLQKQSDVYTKSIKSDIKNILK